MKNLGIILTFVFGLIGCEGTSELFKKNEYYELPVSTKTQLNETDTLVFKNENLILDSFIVKNIVKGNWQLALSGTSGKEPYAFHEFEYIMINNIHDSFDSFFRYNSMITQSDGNYGEGANSLEKSCDSLIIGIEIGTRNIWNATYENASKDYLPILNWYNQKGFEFTKAHSVLIINNVEYFDVQEFTSTSGVKTILYDYEFGIIEYTDSENHIWTRLK